MRVLVLTASQRLPDLSTFYVHLARQLELDIQRLDKAQQLNLRAALSGLDLQGYTCILIDLPFRHICRQSSFLRTLRRVLIYEEDACQNYLRSSRHFGAFSQFYARLPGVRVVVTGASLAKRLQREGVDAQYLAKGYDPARLFVEPIPRDIELGFIGRVSSAEYVDRQRLLQQLAASEPLRLLRTAPGDDYRRMLNRIQIFVSADIGFDEYMAKNFEAMACGCLLLAWRQPGEELALELREHEHLLLYSDLQELREHIARLRADPARLQQIAKAGQQWANRYRSYPAMADALARILQAPWPEMTAKPYKQGWRALWPF